MSKGKKIKTIPKKKVRRSYPVGKLLQTQVKALSFNCAGKNLCLAARRAQPLSGAPTFSGQQKTASDLKKNKSRSTFFGRILSFFKTGYTAKKSQKTNSELHDKKGVEAWLSWVLLVGLSVVLGMFVLKWSSGLVTQHAEDLKERADYSMECQDTGIKIKAACQNTQTLNINITNNNNKKIDVIMVSMVDIYGNPQLRAFNATIKPEESQQLIIVKQGLAQRADVIPAFISNKRTIICQTRKVSLEPIPVCI